MQVKTIGQGPHPDFSISGNIVTVAGVEIDTAARQSEGQSIIDVRTKSGRAQEGGSGYQLATIVIPPRTYEEVESTEEEEDGGEARRPLLIDTRRAVVTIWPAV